jgi:hypothetical protein
LIGKTDLESLKNQEPVEESTGFFMAKDGLSGFESPETLSTYIHVGNPKIAGAVL